MEQIHQTLQRNEEINRGLVEVLQKNTRRPVTLNATGNFIGSAALAVIVLILSTWPKWTSWLNTQLDRIGGADGAPLSQLIASIANVLIAIVGGIAVIMIVIGGVRYVTSNGEPQIVAGAKDAILYAIIGLVLAIAAFAIVNFVITKFS